MLRSGRPSQVARNFQLASSKKNIQYILFKKCIVQKTIRMIGEPNGAIKLYAAAVPVKRQVLPYFFNYNFTFQISRTFSDPEGRFIICHLTVNEKKLTLANIYAPNNGDPNFFTSVFSHLVDFMCEEDIKGGDFNLILDVEKD